ncbi:NADH:flavin oxidoreductase [Rhizosaccharibacter radicis]|uniref:NADH:flavin oxidoreductase n=1 Tax=Rhizosaccharibacter radicis TaxID=2782605 RepID=A0ABT1VTX2_9PROT|nr:NADH:flavin oxidoreductase [Acetobacteraceae bacterium KSS12]
MSDLAASLFQPFRVRGLAMPNRIVMAPMTRSFSPGGVPGPDVAAYYRRRAEGEVGLILTEGTVIERPAARNHPGIPFFHGEGLPGWSRVVEEVHAGGGRIAPQIWHTGSVKSFQTAWEPDAPVESPSGLVAPDQPRGVSMSDNDIADTIAAFGRAAAEARRLGFDAVELHGAHGYLIDQFFWAGTNRRDDRWGGISLRERSRFAAAVVAAARENAGPELPVILRVSQWKQQDYAARLATTPDEMTEWLLPLVEAGVDILHCSQRRFWEPEFPEIDGPEGLNFAGWARKLTDAVTITVGSVGLSGDVVASFGGESSEPASLEKLLQRLERDEFDLVAVGRALLSDPRWVTRIRTGDRAGLRAFSAGDLATLS